MKKLLLLFICVLNLALLQAQTTKTLNLTAGALSTALTASEKATITNLTLTGTIDARDFKTMRDNMSLLASINLSGVTVVAYTGTDGTASTNSIIYPANEIPEYSFYNPSIGQAKTSVTSFSFPSSVTSISSNAFYGCQSLPSITIPASVTSIGSSAFMLCSCLINVDANNPNYSSLDGVLFNKIQTILIQSPVSKTGNYTFPSSVTSIEVAAFWYCSGLTAITISSSVTSIGIYAFHFFSGSINVDANNPNYSSLDGVLFNKTQTTLIQSPVSKTGNYSVPSSVTFIGAYAFWYCDKLTTVTIPSSVTSIGVRAFELCVNLSFIYAYGINPVNLSSSDRVFGDVNKTTCTLYVPYGSKPAYQVANQWKDFTNIVEKSANAMPVVAITSPVSPATTLSGTVVTITANASDADGTIAKVEFFDGATKLGEASFAPYEYAYTGVAGVHTITAVATDNEGGTTTSAPLQLTVGADPAPIVSITSPVNGASLNIGAAATITATATDNGTVSSVVFKIDGVIVGTITPPAAFTYSWTPATARNGVVITFIATDNLGGITTKSVTVNVIDPDGIAPYEIGETLKFNEVKEKCFVNTVSIPVYSTTAMTGVIGYDIALKYDDTKVVPTGRITVSNALLVPETATITSYVTNIDATNSLMNISIFFNGTAIATSNFHGAGQLFSAEFTKKPAFITGEAVFSMPIFDESKKVSTSSTVTKGGKFIAYIDTEFNGSLIYWKGNSAIKYDIAHPLEYLITNISGNIHPEIDVQPDLFGNFKYNTENGHTIDIKRDIVNTTDVHTVIMSNDALVAAYIANKNATLFTPNVFNMIAADVNLDGVVSAGDASQINLRAVNEIGEFSQAWNASLTPSQPSKDWLFVNSATLALDAYKISGTYPNDDQMGFSKNRVPAVTFGQALPWADWTGCPEIVGEVFKGIMLGDVNGDYVAIANDGKLKSAKVNNDLVILDFTKATDYNNVVTVPVSVSTTLPELHAIDLGIFINDENIENIEIGQNDNFSSLNLGYNADTKKLNIAGFNFNSIPTSNSFSLVITKRSPEALTASDFDAVQVDLTNNPMGEIVKGRLNVVGLVTGIAKPGIDNAESVLVYPNPANDHLNVKVSEDSNIQIFDMSNKLLIETTVKVGVNDISGIQKLSNGIYMMKISNGKSTSMNKIIIKK